MGVAFCSFLALILFAAVVSYFGLPTKVFDLLDARSRLIAAELDEAVRIRKEVGRLLVEQKRLSSELEVKVQTIVDDAKKEADAILKEGQQAITEMTVRRTKIVESRIAAFKEQASLALRREVVDMAMMAVKILLDREPVSDAKGDRIIIRDISAIRSRLN